MKCINPLTTNDPHHTETSQLSCFANQLLVSISWETLAVNGLKGALGFLMIPGEIEVN